MGAGIVEVTVAKDYDVVLKDSAPAGLARGLSGIQKSLDQRVKRKQITPFERSRTMSRIMALSDDDANWPAVSWLHLVAAAFVLTPGTNGDTRTGAASALGDATESIPAHGCFLACTCSISRTSI